MHFLQPWSVMPFREKNNCSFAYCLLLIATIYIECGKVRQFCTNGQNERRVRQSNRSIRVQNTQVRRREAVYKWKSICCACANVQYIIGRRDKVDEQRSWVYDIYQPTYIYVGKNRRECDTGHLSQVEEKNSFAHQFMPTIPVTQNGYSASAT